jgi:hypothetical protein
MLPPGLLFGRYHGIQHMELTPPSSHGYSDGGLRDGSPRGRQSNVKLKKCNIVRFFQLSTLARFRQQVTIFRPARDLFADAADPTRRQIERPFRTANPFAQGCGGFPHQGDEHVDLPRLELALGKGEADAG